MEQPNKITKVKAYLTKNKAIEEIRFFELPPEGTNYNFLLEKIKNTFNLDAESFKLFWQDSDSDYISFSNNDELQAAINECSSQNTLPIYVALKKAENRGESREENHPGVVCDGCNSDSFKGMRYKCKTCGDFDICGSCRAAGVHNHHEFMEIVAPKKFSFEFNMSGPDFGEDYPGFGWPPKNQRPRHGRRGFGGCGRGGGGGGGGGGGRGRWAFQTAGGPFEGFGCGAGNSRNRDHPMPPPPPPPHCTWFHNMGGDKGPFVSVATGVSTDSNTTTTNMPFPDVAKVAEEATQFATQMASRHMADVMRGIWSAWEGNQAANRGPSEDAKKSPEEPIPENTTPAACTCLPKENPPKSKGDQKVPEDASAKGDETPRSQRSSNSPEMVVMDVDDCVPSQAKKPNSDDWTLVNKDTQGEEQQQQPAAEKEQAADVPVSNEGPSRHPEERIRKALDHMRAMGYSDEGGWLTRLLEMKNGDINQVLDLLLVHRK